jgi:phage terminase large subunit
VWQTFIRDADETYVVVRSASAENEFLDDAIVEMWEREYTGDFARQELGGEFVAFEGLIYADFSRDKHISRHRPESFSQVVVGVDWGFANPGVMLVIGVDGDGRGYLLEEHYQTQRRIEEGVNVALDIRGRWNPGKWLCDPSEPDYIDKLRERGLAAEPANNRVLPGIQAVQNRLVVGVDGKPRLFVSPDAINTIAEFESYQWAENRYGLRDAPLKTGDHTMDALRYAIMGIDGARWDYKIDIGVNRYA